MNRISPLPPTYPKREPDVVPASPPQEQTCYTWYPAVHQQHYSIKLGNSASDDGEDGNHRYRIVTTQAPPKTAQQGTIQEAPTRSSMISPWPKMEDKDEDSQSNNKPKVLQTPPSNADQVFRPRQRTATRKRRGDFQDKEEDTSETGTSTSTLPEKRQDSPITNSMTLAEKTDKDDPRDCEDDNIWEPIPLANIWDNEESFAQIVMEDAHKLPDWLWKQTLKSPDNQSTNWNSINMGKTADNTNVSTAHGRPTFQLKPRYTSRTMCTTPNTRMHRPHRAYSGTRYPCPVSPVSSRKKPKKDHAPWSLIVSPEAETARRLAASDQFACVPHLTSNSKRKSYMDMPELRSNKASRASKSSSPVPCASLLPSSWPQDEALLQRFYEYCTTSRPHLLHTLRDAVKESQAEQSPEIDGSHSLVSKVMDKLVKVWGGPLLGEVYRRVLAHGDTTSSCGTTLQFFQTP